MAIAPSNYKHSSRWLNFCPCTYPGPPGPGPGPGKKRRRSLAGGLAWVLLGLVWLGSPLIIDCRTDENFQSINKLIKNDYLSDDDNKRTSDSNLINIYKINNKKHHLTDQINESEFVKSTILDGNGCPNCLYNNLDNKFSISFLSSTKKLKSTISPTKTILIKHRRHQLNNKKKQKQQKRKKYNLKKNNLNSDIIRLESIKHQILSKLGLKHKPNVTQLFPKQVIIDTIMRAGEKNFDDKLTESDYKRDSVQNDMEPEPDDFYGRTREIISFAERGKSI